MEKVKVNTREKAYEIHIESGLFSKLPEVFKEKYSGKKIALVSDNNVYKIYGESFKAGLVKAGFEVTEIVFNAGEENKNISTLSQIYSVLAENFFTRSDIVVALGGGVTGDMAGLAAATFLRGMGFIQIPTTLLAMVDSSIGGKVAVDLPQGKNLVGAFYQPDAVYTDPQLLKTLPDLQFSDGMAELLKHGFIRDRNLFNTLILKDVINLEHEPESIAGLRSLLSDKMDYIIKESCIIKRDIVEQDVNDNGIRQLLNFGHTIGHAIERVQNYSGYTHGQAISIGMVIMTRLTEKMGLTKAGKSRIIENALKMHNLPVFDPALDIKSVTEAIKIDKKARSGSITIAYIEEIGQGKLLKLDIKDLEDKINDVYNDFAFTS
ncbi:MAG: 3-dehydroquinate synthase [Clostridiaceae bacterium]|nr:3-dehydroquinate synthase [Clostridiaceae bacterium]